jgi:hypothetical protein
LSKVVKKLSKSCQNVVKKLSHKVVTIGQTLKPKARKPGKFARKLERRSSNPKLEKPINLKEEATKNQRVWDDKERRSNDEETRHP